jgi:hypothetical protein
MQNKPSPDLDRQTQMSPGWRNVYEQGVGVIISGWEGKVGEKRGRKSGEREGEGIAMNNILDRGSSYTLYFSLCIIKFFLCIQR